MDNKMQAAIKSIKLDGRTYEMTSQSIRGDWIL